MSQLGLSPHVAESLPFRETLGVDGFVHFPPHELKHELVERVACASVLVIFIAGLVDGGVAVRGRCARVIFKSVCQRLEMALFIEFVMFSDMRAVSNLLL